MVGTRPRRFAATPDGKELWVSTELSGEVYIIDREKFAVSGKIDFLPPGMRKTDVTPVDLRMTKDGKTAYVTLGHAAHVAVVDVADPQDPGLYPGRQPSLGLGMSPRREDALCGQRLRRRRHGRRCAEPQGRSIRFRSAASPGASSSMIKPRRPRRGGQTRVGVERGLPCARPLASSARRVALRMLQHTSRQLHSLSRTPAFAGRRPSPCPHADARTAQPQHVTIGFVEIAGDPRHEPIAL